MAKMMSVATDPKKRVSKQSYISIPPSNATSASQVKPETHHVQRKLKARHLQMIAIGGTIGTGLFVASGNSLAEAGPLGCLIAYATVGIMVYFVVSSLGEMATLIPVTGSFNTYASRFIDPALGFTMGWNYWLSWAIGLPTEVTAITMITQFWLPNVESWMWTAGILVLLFCLNLLGVKGFGEAEYWFSLTKVYFEY